MTTHPHMSRRRFLQAAGLGGALVWVAPWRGLTGGEPARAALRFGAPLPRPVELTSADIELRAVLADVQLLPDGPPTRMWTFNGVFPGPTIRRPAGARTTVTVHHDLPPEVGSLTIHHHGGHQASDQDGQPERGVIEPGASRQYVYELTDDGNGERAALQWYHDHSHLRTGRNTWMGLAGMFIVDDGVDAQLGLPTGDRDVALLVTDRAFDDGNQLVDRFTAPGREERAPQESVGAGHPPSDEVTGDVFLVNGVPEPHLDVDACRYRLRILNASNFRVFNIGLSDGRPLLQVGNESGLLPAPVERTAVLLGPAERAEVVVDFTGLEGQAVELVSVPLEEGSLIPLTAPTPAELMRFNVGGAAAGPAAVPASLQPLPAWVEGLSHTPDRVWVFSLGADGGGRPAWTVNGRAFDHARVDARPELGSSETWMFVNAGPVAISHYIHIHDVDWLLLSRNLAPPDPWEAGLKETFRLDPGEVLLVGTRFTDHLGPFMIHCHMLEHEDHGMMTTFEVVEPGSGDAPTAHLGAADPVAALIRASVAPPAVPAALDVVQRVASSQSRAPLSRLDGPPPAIAEPLICKIEPDPMELTR